MEDNSERMKEWYIVNKGNLEPRHFFKTRAWKKV